MEKFEALHPNLFRKIVKATFDKNMKKGKDIYFLLNIYNIFDGKNKMIEIFPIKKMEMSNE
jgi:hypothetical protein